MARNRARTTVVLAAIAALSLPASRARADAYQATLTRAIAAKERALDVNEPARWEEALRLFQEADAIRSTRETLYELGYAAERLSRQDLAVEAYEAALDRGLGGAARSKAAAFVKLRGPSMARLKVFGERPGRVRVAGVERGRLPLPRPLVLFAEDTELELVDLDGRRTTFPLSLAPGRTSALDLDAVAAEVAAAPTEPTPAPAPVEPLPATVAPAAPAPAPPAPAPPVAAPPAPPATAPGPAATRTPRAGASGGHSDIWLIAGGVVIAAAGGIMVAVANRQLDDLRSDLAAHCDSLMGTDACYVAKPGPDMQAQAKSDVDGIASWKAVRLGAWIGLGVGAAVTSAGILVAIFGGGREDGQVAAAGAPARPGRWVVAPLIGGTEVGLGCSGRF